MKSLTVLSQILKYAKINRKYWLVPFAFTLIAVAIIIVTAQGSIVAPFIYALF
tara:strand:- start:213 stop:371 length:159 start_codon:yes stop_codon:yes gene_type:complete